MYYSQQALVHKRTRKYAKLDLADNGQWAWNIGKKTPFINAQGRKFTSNINNYEPIQNEWGDVVIDNCEHYITMTESVKNSLKQRYFKRFKADAKTQILEFFKFLSEKDFSTDRDFVANLLHMSYSRFINRVSMRGVYDQNIYIPNNLMRLIKVHDILIEMLKHQGINYMLYGNNTLAFKSGKYLIVGEYIDSRFDLRINKILEESVK